jgi:hypothetical protein
LAKRIEVPVDPIGISAPEFEALEALTKRFSGDVKAIFSVNREGDIFPPPGKGKTHSRDRECVTDILYVLDQLARSLQSRRIEGGRMFVNLEGAFWKKGPTGRIERVQFVRWRWKGDPPIRHQMTDEEFKAKFGL